MLSDLLYRLRALFQKDSLNDELREELEYHVEREAAKYREAGAAPEEASRRARMVFGGTTQVEQKVREQRGVSAVEGLMQDMRFALRQLRRSPGFTATAVLTLALSIGATIAMVSIAKSVLIEPLAYPQQDRLVGVSFTPPQNSPNDDQAGITANFLLQHAKSFQSMAAYNAVTSGANLAVGNQTSEGAVQVALQPVDRNFFPTLGVQPILGRNFSAEEDRRSGPKAIILSYGVWQRLFNVSTGVINQVVHLNGESYTIMGVMPASLTFGSDDPRALSAVADVWTPLRLDTSDAGTNYNMIARLREGVTIEQARQELASFNKPLYKEFPLYSQWLTVAHTAPEFRLWPLQQVMVSNIRTSLIALTAAVSAVLFVACLNLAGLMAARANRRQREIALRSALGASRGAILRLLISESLLLAIAGSAMGILLARVMVPALLRSSPIPIPQASGASVLMLIVFTLPLVFTVTLVCGLLPSWLIVRRNTAANLQSGHAVGASSSDARIGRVLLVSQTAVTVLLLSAASLLLAVFLRLRSTPSGVQAQHLTVAQVNLKGGDYSTVAQTMQFIDKVSDRLRHYPGVQHVGVVNGFPLDRGLNIIMGPGGKQGNSYIVELRLVTPGYFKAIGIPLLAGRDVAESDNQDSPPVIILSQAMVNKLGLGQSAVGEHPDGLYQTKNSKMKMMVIGVVGDSHTHSLAEDPALLIYEPFTQQSDDSMSRMNGWFRTSFAIRSGADTDLAAAVQKAIHDADPGIPISRYTTMQTIIDHSLARPRFFSSLVTMFAGFALVLTVIGLFGLLSYQVTQRTREIGVRIALGATRGNVLGLILRRGLVLTVIGLVMGSAASLMLPRLIHSIMSDIITGGSSIALGLLSTLPALTMACGAMLIAAVLASYLPARRASSIEPIEALRTE